MRKKRIILLLVLLLFLLAAPAAVVLARQASPAALQTIAVDWWVFAGGGDRVERTGITLEDTLGQPLIGLSENGNVSLGSGYWYGMQYPASLYLPLLRR
jgi:hypothetical protein